MNIIVGNCRVCKAPIYINQLRKSIESVNINKIGTLYLERGCIDSEVKNTGTYIDYLR